MNLTECKFLVVDDMQTMRKMMTYTLKAFNITQIADAVDGNTAWELLQNEAKNGKPFHIVVSDWNMPNMTGIELAKKCRASETFKNIGFVLVTAEAGGKNESDAQAAGVDNFLVKPIDNKILLDVLENIVKKRLS